MDFQVVGTPVPAPGVDLTAYRIVQEALTTIRHARAAAPRALTRLRTGLRHGERHRFRPRHRGHPLGPLLTGAGSSGLGLAGIAERVASCGGNLTVGPTQADGFAVTARLPSR